MEDSDESRVGGLEPLPTLCACPRVGDPFAPLKPLRNDSGKGESALGSLRATPVQD